MSVFTEVMEKTENSVRKTKSGVKRRSKSSSTSDGITSDITNGPIEKKINNHYSNENWNEKLNGNALPLPHLQTKSAVNGVLHVNSPSKIQQILQSQQLAQPTFQQHLQQSTVSPYVMQQSSKPQQQPLATTHSQQQPHSNGANNVNNHRPPRTSEDFYLFCQFILEYENYVDQEEESRESANSILDSSSSVTESTTSSSPNEEHGSLNPNKDAETANGGNAPNTSMDTFSTNDEDSDIDSESYNLVTCFCGKPYAARPMIECSKCLTWLHFSCAKIRRKHIPDVFICSKCTKLAAVSNENGNTAENNEPKENKAIVVINSSRVDKSEKILQPLNVSASLEATANLNNIKMAEANAMVVNNGVMKPLSTAAPTTTTTTTTSSPINNKLLSNNSLTRANAKPLLNS